MLDAAIKVKKQGAKGGRWRIACSPIRKRQETEQYTY
jgi:hypothetical protein